MTTPVFIISLPRSGSTLLQRMLMTHPEIDSRSEPWFLLPLFYMTKTKGCFSEYSHSTSSSAIQDLVSELPGKETGFNSIIRNFASEVYGELSSNRYFIDKTPRYYLIINELLESFPDAKFIFLVRNPISILSSLIHTFCNDNLKSLHRYHIDLQQGIESIQRGMVASQGRSITVKYEELVSQPVSILNELCEYLDLPYSDDLIGKFSDSQLGGRMGDPTGTKIYSRISNLPQDKWKETLNTKVRMNLAKKWIFSIPETELQTYGYEQKGLISALKDHNPSPSVQSFYDRVNLFLSGLFLRTNLNLFLRNKEDSKWFRHTSIS